VLRSRSHPHPHLQKLEDVDLNDRHLFYFIFQSEEILIRKNRLNLVNQSITRLREQIQRGIKTRLSFSSILLCSFR
jgi:hypothetical protein